MKKLWKYFNYPKLSWVFKVTLQVFFVSVVILFGLALVVVLFNLK
ncbi:hypothetical protein [Lactiplantibacillus plantarum]|nr:hypothetical protein [Lactiplantibacillus plantarum]